jgi:DNA-binding NtrC family response regulator
MVEERGRVLVVDDEEGVRNLLQRILEGAGFNVVTAADGQETLETISEPDLEIGVLLLDIKMPGLSGIEVLQRVSIEHPLICVIMVSAMVDTTTAVEAMKLGAYDYVTKPFNPDDVVLAVQRGFERRTLWLENEKHRRRLQEKLAGQTERMQEQFTELMNSLTREHQLLFRLKESRPELRKEILSKLPKELQEPIASAEEFRDALLKILRRS